MTAGRSWVSIPSAPAAVASSEWKVVAWVFDGRAARPRSRRHVSPRIGFASLRSAPSAQTQVFWNVARPTHAPSSIAESIHARTLTPNAAAVSTSSL